jgi:hypothetical protein
MSKLSVVKTSFREKNYKEFGKFIINHAKLNKNILLIKYPKSLAPVSKIRSTKISNDFKNLIVDLLDTETINVVLQKKLKLNEVELFELLLRVSGLKEQLNYKKIEQSDEDLVHRFYILRGELTAGNDSEIMKQELISVINILNSKGKINNTDAIELIAILTEK